MKCPKCNGKGFVDNPRFYSYKTGCNDAYQHGIEPTKKCVTCNGRGYIVGNPKERCNWKPSLAQLTALSIVSKGNAPDDIEAIRTLYNDLKKLMEE